jgi:hypothetical protein
MIHTDQAIVTILKNREDVIVTLQRAEVKFPGYHKINISKKWSFQCRWIWRQDAWEMAYQDDYKVKYSPNGSSLNKW